MVEYTATPPRPKSPKRESKAALKERYLKLLKKYDAKDTGNITYMLRIIAYPLSLTKL